MPSLTLDQCRQIIAVAFEKGAALKLKPLSVVVLDAGGHLKAFERQDGASNLRFQIANGKAYGALAVGMGSRGLFKRAQEQAYFVQALNGLANGAVVPVPGGVLIKSSTGEIIGAVGVTGDTSDNDEICAVAAIESVGFAADPG